MSEQNMKSAEESPSESLKAWAEGLSETEADEINLLISVYGYSEKGAAELLLLNQKGVEALKGLTQIVKEPQQFVDGYDELSAVDRSRALHEKKLTLRQQLENSLALASDRLYDYSDAEISNFEQEAGRLFNRTIEHKEAA